jgi:hypothetical protein
MRNDLSRLKMGLLLIDLPALERSKSSRIRYLSDLTVYFVKFSGFSHYCFFLIL